jgi:release factor glutamine methyltransferase
MTARILEQANKTLAGAGIKSARLDAEVLLSHILGCNRIDLYLDRKRTLSEKELAAFSSLINRRAKREPVAYIVGFKEFWSRKIKVTPDVLIPRPETEGIVELAVKLLSPSSMGEDKGEGDRSPPPYLPHQWGGNLNILDLCTGSGCLAAALAVEFPNAKITVTDISHAAIEVAKENLAFAGGRITFCTGDLFSVFDGSRVTGHGPCKFDLITANPPYIPEKDFDKLEPEITKYEPRAALSAGSDGLAFSRKILKDGPAFLKPNGTMIMEIGTGQSAKLADEALKKGYYKKVFSAKDYSGTDRYIVAQL